VLLGLLFLKTRRFFKNYIGSETSFFVLEKKSIVVYKTKIKKEL